MKVKKYSGELVDFNLEKFRQSLLKSGASYEKVEFAIQQILPKLEKDIIHTQALYKLAHQELKKQEPSFAARYSLKRALQDLGPSGYFFEKWIGKLFEHEGCKVVTGHILKGKAVSHEIDVLVKKNNKFEIVECKFRNTPEAKISVTTPMYFLSRINDLKGTSPKNDQNTPIEKGWLVTNAFLTKDSIQFAEYYEIGLISWDYPEKNSLKVRVDNESLYPLTCLTKLNKAEKLQLLEKNCILVKDLLLNTNLLKVIRVPAHRIAKIIEEATHLTQ